MPDAGHAAGLLGRVIDETGIAPEKVKLHQTYVGGGFGRGTQGDDVRMVVAVAKEFPGVPVKTIWSREECFQAGPLSHADHHPIQGRSGR